MNDGGCEWPESTELIFVAGYSLSPTASIGDGIPIPVGKIGLNKTIDIITGDLKAPEVPGTYVGHWRLRAAGELFGSSVWIV
jgi:next-to-BRCA1 protein 1